MAGPMDYLMGAGQSLGQAMQPVQKYVEGNQPLSPIQKYISEMLAGRMSPQEASVRARLEMQGHVPATPAPQQQVPLAQQAVTPSAMPHTGVSMAPGSEGGLSAQAMAMANQTPQGMTAQGPMPPAPPVRQAPPMRSEDSQPRMPMPTNQREYEQLMGAYGSMGKQKTTEDKLYEILMAERIKQPNRREIAEITQGGQNSRTTATLESGERRTKAQTESAERIAGLREQGAKDRATAEQGNKDRNYELDRQKAASAIARNNASIKWIDSKLQGDGGKLDVQTRNQMVRMVGQWRATARSIRRGDAFGKIAKENKGELAKVERLAEKYEQLLIEKFGPAIGEELDAYEGSNVDANVPGGMSPYVSPTERALNGDLDFAPGSAPQPGNGSVGMPPSQGLDPRGEHPIDTSEDVMEPDELGVIERRFHPKYGWLGKDRSGRVRRLT